MTTERIGVRRLEAGWQVFYRGSLEHIAYSRVEAEAIRIKAVCDAEYEAGRRAGIEQAAASLDDLCIGFDGDWGEYNVMAEDYDIPQKIRDLLPPAQENKEDGCTGDT